ncbi:outer membrane protein assembly factor BamD [Gammaproteobacteria bacterium 45_16_T64]|nr:outer membrane protein assembly factor BamD [Gammaproteobacteria bacterium 45_16_T64]
MNQVILITKRGVITLLLALSLAACSSTPEKKEQLTEKQYYEDAQAAMANNRFLLAIEKLQSLESRYPFGRYADQAQLELVYCYYRTIDFESSAITAERFIRLHPDHPDLDYAYYMKGLASYSVDRGLVERFIPTDFSERDMGPARESFDDFNRLINRFPSSEYAEDARQRMIYLRNLLAAYELKAAKFYISRGAYIAAVKRATFIVQNYDRTPSLPEALAIMTKTYRELGLPELANTAEQTLAYNFPQYDGLNDAGKLDYSPQKRQKTTLLNVITFGLLD